MTRDHLKPAAALITATAGNPADTPTVATINHRSTASSSHNTVDSDRNNCSIDIAGLPHTVAGSNLVACHRCLPCSSLGQLPHSPHHNFDCY